jgi:hypothetical protein
MSEIAEDVPEEILELMRQKDQLQQQIDAWKKQEEAKRLKAQEKTELTKFMESLSKKRTFHKLNFSMPKPKRLRRCFHNIKVIQQKEDELTKERNGVKEECINDIKKYLEDMNNDSL